MRPGGLGFQAAYDLMVDIVDSFETRGFVLEGLVVLEMGAGSVPASFAGMLFADYGARVVKIEPPEGDALRRARESAHLVWNRGKDSLVIDLRTSGGQAELRQLAKAADVVLEGFGTGVVDSWGVGYDVLSSANRAIVFCSIKGFGSTGAYAHIPAYEGIVRAKTGHYDMGAFGFRSGPLYNDAFMASTGAGHQAFAGSMAALTARETTGRGQLVEASLVQGLVPYDYFGMATAQHMAKLAAEAGADASDEDPMAKVAMGASRLSFAMPTADGRWVSFTHMMPKQAQALTRVLGLEACFEDPRYAPQPFFGSPEDAQAWEDMCWDALRTKTYAEWEPLLLASPDIAFEMARTSEEGLDHAQIIANSEAITLDDPDHGLVRQVGPIGHLQSAAHGPSRSAPRLGDAGEPITAGERPTGGGPAPEHPLAGLRIIELGYFYAMPYGVTMAATLGAEVIKIEGLTGDPMRDSFGFPETGAAKTMEGKHSLAIDLAAPAGRKVMHELVATADVFVNGFRPGVAERLGLGHDELREIKPDLLYIHAAGYGVEGSHASRPIYAGVASAIAGQVTRHAGSWLNPELTMSLPGTVEAQAVVLPRLRGPVDGDANAASAVFSTLLLGIYNRRRSGDGNWISTTMIGGNALAYSDDFVTYADKKPLPVADSEMHGLNALYRLYEVQNGWVFVAAPRQKEWEALANAIGLSDLIDDPRFASANDRTTNDGPLISAIEAALKPRDAQALEDELTPQGIAVVKASDGGYTAFCLSDPVMRETGQIVQVESPVFGPILRAAPPVRFSETPSVARPGCTSGQYTRSILASIGYDDASVDQLISDHVVATER